MSSAAARQKTKKARGAAPGTAPKAAGENRTPLVTIPRGAAVLMLMALALLYAFLAGFHTIFDFDLGWHLATGRWVVEHHAIPSTDVLSYPAAGEPWLYPPLAGVVMYGLYSLGGYAALTWLCALAMLAMAACLLVRPSRPESLAAAALTILAVSSVALRAVPRPDMFSHIFFAIFLVLLWRFHCSSGEPGRRQWLWALPPVMLLWANFHPGFIAGIGLLAGYLALELLELPFASRRAGALRRLKAAWLPLALALPVTLLNPYGSRTYGAALVFAGMQSSTAAAQPLNALAITELEPIPVSLPDLAEALDLRHPNCTFWWLAMLAVALVGLALWRRRLGAALWLAAALYGCFHHLRYKGMFALAVVVVGSTLLSDFFHPDPEVAPRPRLRLLPAVLGVLLCLLSVVHIVDLVTSRALVLENSAMLFGPGESWWFPERAAAFIEREHLPGNMLQTYSLGGFVSWRLGPAGYRNYIDGRNVSAEVRTEYQALVSSQPDSPTWQSIADRRGVNMLFFPLARINGVGTFSLPGLCRSTQWRPVYLDEVAIVLLRNTPQNQSWIARYPVDCETHQFTPPVGLGRIELASFYANAGTVLQFLNRHDEARKTLLKAEALEPADPTVHLELAQAWASERRYPDAEDEFKQALALRRDLDVVWYALARFYAMQGRYAEARPLVETAVQLSRHPANDYVLLGKIDLSLGDPEKAAADFDRAESSAGEWSGHEQHNPELFAQIAEGRATVCAARHDLRKAVEYAQEATRLTPQDAGRWEALAEISQAAGKSQLADEARLKAAELRQR